MFRQQHKNIINNSQDKISPLESTHPTTQQALKILTYIKQEKNFKTNHMKALEVLTKGINKFCKKFQESMNKQLEKIKIIP